MRELGEIEWAGDEIALADKEQEPHEVLPYDIGKLIRDMECKVREGKANDTWDDMPTLTIMFRSDVLLASRASPSL